MNSMSREEILKFHQSHSPKDLIGMFEGLRQKLWDVVDIKDNPSYMFKPEVIDIVTEFVTENYQSVIESVDYGNETQVVESFTDNGNDVVLPVNQVHVNNLKQLLENSATEVRAANANQFNLNQLTPFDAFLPFVIVRSYLPLIGKDLMPTITPPQPFIRIKQMYKYIVTKDNTKHLRPDIYSNSAAAKAILDTAKGPRVTDAWYPAGTEVQGVDGAAPDTYDYIQGGRYFTVPEDAMKAQSINVLEESGGLVQVGDALDIDVCVDGIRAVVTATDGTTTVVTQTGYAAYPDLTSITPQRSVSFEVKIPVKNASGKVESYVKDRILGDFNAATNTFNLVSMYGYVKQIQFNGHMSNKNNTEYLSFTNEYGVEQHPIPEGYTSNVPITHQDMQLYNETASIDIVANAMSEMTEIFTQLEDNETINKIDEDFVRWQGKGADEHPFQHMFGPVVFERTVDVRHDSTRLLKRYEVVQDEINNAVRAFVGEIRNTMQNEPFRLVAFCHPNVAALFVGNNVDWKITQGATGMDGVRMDYSMGVYTSSGESFRVITSMKIKEADGIRFLVFPVNEQNFKSWAHYKYSMFFDRDHRNAQMPLVPNIMGYSRFYTHSYTPLQGKLYIENYNN